MKTATYLILLFIGLTNPLIAQTKYLENENKVIAKSFENTTFYSNYTLQKNLETDAQFSNFSSILKTIGFEDLINSNEMVTVFVMNDKGFDFLNEKELKQFLSVTNSSQLRSILANHTIPGRVDAHFLKSAILKGNGSTKIRTLGNSLLLFSIENDRIVVQDESGAKAHIMDQDFMHNKGFFHIISKLIHPLK